ncbi:MAG: HD domain-containing protein, partial [Pyrinomonadaceae bacterium]|nr:HD domain-containing protein [Pyrinomonadaceae bacterium]
LELVPQVLGRAPDTQVILVSGSQDIEHVIEALRVGAFDYITKPFDLRELDATMQRAVEHYELRTAKRRYEDHLRELVEQRTAALDRALDSLEGAYRATLKSLVAALEPRDLETHGHSERVVSFSMRIGRELSLNDEEWQALEFGSLLHDIGKIGVPDAILRKPGKLTEDEWVVMRQHPALGEQILRGINFLEGAVRVVAQHHEQWNGRGYPRHLRAEEIDLNARIFAVADAFDAMTSDRVYRRAISYEEAVEEFNKFSGIQFDPRIVEIFHQVPREEWEELRRRSLDSRQTSDSIKFTDVASLQLQPIALAS